MKEIPLTQGKVALVDDEDYESLNAFKWHAANCNGAYYAARSVWIGLGKQRYVLMHRELLNVSREVDHINNDGLDNRRANLRPASRSQQNQNSRKRMECSSVFKGVYWNIPSKKWQAYIRVNHIRIHLGLFHCEKAAALAYDSAAVEAFGDYAKTNASLGLL